MNDDIYSLIDDIRQCIVNGANLNANYNLLIYEQNTMNMNKSLCCFENLEIFPDNKLMKFKGKIANDLKVTEEDLYKIKKHLWNKNMSEIINQREQSLKSEEQKEIEKEIIQQQLDNILIQAENTEYEYRKPTNKEIEKIKRVQEKLKNMGLDLDYEEHEEILMLCANFKYLKFNKKELRKIIELIDTLDVLLIAPSYNMEDEEDEEAKSIRIVLGIDLREENKCMK
ncbi:MAG: hypothetical protein ACI31S_01435 [Bacilli bacterium]